MNAACLPLWLNSTSPFASRKTPEPPTIRIVAVGLSRPRALIRPSLNFAEPDGERQDQTSHPKLSSL